MLKLKLGRIDEMVTLQLSISGRLDFRRRFLAMLIPRKQSCSVGAGLPAADTCHALCHANGLPRGLPREY
jgi:hypothetical protein